jgi:DNA-binding LacI/PurR family transcriptional regulator
MREKKIRLVDIAEKAGVSRFTVAKVLLGSGSSNVRVGKETREKIEQLASDMGYIPNVAARMLKGVESNVVAVFIDSRTTAVDFMILAELERELTACDCRMMVIQTHNNLKQISTHVAELKGRGVADAICLSHEYPDMAMQVAETIQGLGKVVFINRPVLENCSYVANNDTVAIREAVEHLVAKGRWNIVMMLADGAYINNVERKDAYLAAVDALGLSSEEGLWFLKGELFESEAQQLSEKSADDMIQSMIVEGNSDAVIAPNDDWAAMVIRRLKLMGIEVPGNVAVIGYGNTRLSQLLYPTLTSIDPNISVVAENAVAQLMKLRNKEESAQAIVVEPKLVIREST